MRYPAGSAWVKIGGNSSVQGASRLEPHSAHLQPTLPRLKYDSIDNAEQLAKLCAHLASADRIAFDTEFVSEDTYWSQLCLVQVATKDRLAVIDPLLVKDLKPFWQVLAEGKHQTIVHAGREELLFSLNTIGKRPHNLFDVQIAAGLVGTEYPAGYGSLINRILGIRPPKGETRTDWRRRPLTPQQIEYALADVEHLLPVTDILEKSIADLGRKSWLMEEMETWQSDVEGYLTRPRWRRTSGISGLSRKSLAIVRELWHWREEEAQRLDKPPKRVLRDDLIVEVARRASSDPHQISAIRGMNQRRWQQSMRELSDSVQRGLDNPEPESPRRERSELPGQLNVLGQFLGSALTSICHRAQVAPSLVGTASDVRELIGYHLGFRYAGEDKPVLAEGWRAEVVGHLIEDLLKGKKSIRIADPMSDEPLVFTDI